MEFWDLRKNPRFTRSAIVVGALVAILLVVNIFVIGGDDFFNDSNSLISPIAAWVACLLFIRARDIVKDPISRQLWLGMALGFGLWAAADSIYAFYAVGLGIELPYPSFADVFWLLGYIPLYFALLVRAHSLKIRSTARQRWILTAISLLIFALTVVFVLYPILANFDPTRLVESILNLAYPAGDMGLVILSGRVLVLLQKGRFSLCWRLIFAGIFLMTFSDLLYSFSTWHDLYYPDGRVNLITNLTDTTYWLAYISAAYGVYLYGALWQIKAAPGLSLELMPSTKYQALISTDHDHRVIAVSENFYYLLDAPASINQHYINLTLAEVLNISSAAANQLIERVKHNGFITNTPLTIRTANRQDRDVWLTALAFFDLDQSFTGINIAITADIAAPEDLRMPRSTDFKGMLNHLLNMAGSRPEDEAQEMHAYLLEVIDLFSSMLYQFGGEPFKQALFDELNRTIEQQHLPIRLTSQSIAVPEECQGQALVLVLNPLLQTGLRFTSDLFGPRMVLDEIEDYEKQITPTILRDLDKYDLRQYHLNYNDVGTG